MNTEVRFDEEKFNDYDAAEYKTWTKIIFSVADLLGFSISDLSFDFDSGGQTADIDKSDISKYRKLLENLGFEVYQDFSMGEGSDQGAECVVDYIGMVNGDQPFIVELHWSEKDNFEPQIYFGGFYDDAEIPSAQAKYHNQIRLYKYILLSYIGDDILLEYHSDDKDKITEEAYNQFNLDCDKVVIINVAKDTEKTITRKDVE